MKRQETTGMWQVNIIIPAHAEDTLKARNDTEKKSLERQELEKIPVFHNSLAERF